MPQKAGAESRTTNAVEAARWNEHIRSAADHPQWDPPLVASPHDAGEGPGVDRLAKPRCCAAEPEPGVVGQRLLGRHGNAEVVKRRRGIASGGRSG